MKKHIAVLSLALGLAAGARAQKLPIGIECTVGNSGTDPVGSQLCSALRDTIARSPRYYEVVSNDPHAHLNISIVTVIDDADASSAQSIAFVVTRSGAELLLNHYVTITGWERISFQAHAILANLDQVANTLAQYATSGEEQ